MERRGARRFTGPRALAAEGALFIAGVAAACNPSPAPETQKPTNLPTESPVPTIVVTPSPEVTPIPTPEVTPIPTPEATLKPVTSIIEKKPPVVSFSTVKTSATEVFTNNTQAQTIMTKDYFESDLKGCQGPAHLAEMQASCFDLIFSFYQLYQASNDINAYNVSKNTYDYAVSPNGPYYKYKSDLDSKLQAAFQ